jgi:hypothetical protein
MKTKIALFSDRSIQLNRPFWQIDLQSYINKDMRKSNTAYSIRIDQLAKLQGDNVF